MSDDLYQRYLDAATDYREHRTTCTHCSLYRRCPEGQQRWTAFEQCQAAHIKRVHTQRNPR
ncbi:hypothetical protein ACWEN4_36145 [Streptomyces violaceorubidus]